MMYRPVLHGKRKTDCRSNEVEVYTWSCRLQYPVRILGGCLVWGYTVQLYTTKMSRAVVYSHHFTANFGKKTTEPPCPRKERILSARSWNEYAYSQTEFSHKIACTHHLHIDSREHGPSIILGRSYLSQRKDLVSKYRISPEKNLFWFWSWLHSHRSRLLPWVFVLVYPPLRFVSQNI